MTYDSYSYEDFINIIENYNDGKLIRKSSCLSDSIKTNKEDNSSLEDEKKSIFDIDISSDDLYIISEERVEVSSRDLEEGWLPSSHYIDIDDDIRKKTKHFLVDELKINSLQSNMIINSFDQISIEENDYYSEYIVTYTFMKVEDLYNHLNTMNLLNNYIPETKIRI